MSPREMIVDENCPTCQMFADETALGLGVGFWHLDGCNMDGVLCFRITALAKNGRPSG